MLDLFDFLRNEYAFTRPVQDMHPYEYIEKDGKSIVILNTLGVSEKDMDITVGSEDGQNYIFVNGVTHNEIKDRDYKIRMKFRIRKNIEKIEWESQDGLTYLYISFEEPIKPQVKIVRKG